MREISMSKKIYIEEHGEVKEITHPEDFQLVSEKAKEASEEITKEYFLYKVKQHRIASGVLTLLSFFSFFVLSWMISPYEELYFIFSLPGFFLLFTSFWMGFHFFHTYSPRVALQGFSFPCRKDRLHEYTRIFYHSPWHFWKS